MISLSFINGEYEYLPASDELMTLESVMQTVSDEVDNCISSYLNTREDYLFESKIFGSLDEEKTVFLEAGKDSVFKKIGEAILALIKKFTDAAKKVVEKIKELGFKSKTDTEKLDKLLKQRPELKDEVICAYKSGDLNVADAKSLKELDKAFDEIIKLSKQKDVKPDTLRGKVEAMKKKFANPDDTTLVKTAKATAAVVGAAVAVVTFKKYVLDAKKSSNDYIKSCTEKNEAVYKAIKDLEKYGKETGEDYVSDNLTKAQILKNADMWVTGQYSKLISSEQGKVAKLDKGITSFIAKHMRKDSRDLIYDADIGANEIKKREKKKAKEDFKDARNKAYASEVGKQIYQKKYKNNADRTKVNSAYSNEEGRLRHSIDNEAELNRLKGNAASVTTTSNEEAKLAHAKRNEKELNRLKRTAADASTTGTEEAKLRHALSNERDINSLKKSGATADAYGRAEGSARHRKDHPEAYKQNKKNKDDDED